MRDDLTTLLPHVGQLPPHPLPTTTDPVPTPETDVMRQDCLDDPHRDHWCPVDFLGAAGG